eukprot:155145_1
MATKKAGRNKSRLRIRAKSFDRYPMFESLQTASTKLPSPVLTKQNSKMWTHSDFNEYEKELKQEIYHLLQSTNSNVFKNSKLHPKRRKSVKRA